MPRGRPPVDYIGQRFGRLTVLERAPNQGKKVAWTVACDCGIERIVTSSNLRAGQQSCGCYSAEVMRERRFVELNGPRFGPLTVLDVVPETTPVRFLCREDDGVQTVVRAEKLRELYLRSIR